MSDSLSAGDVAILDRTGYHGNDGFGNNGIIWLFAILLILGGGAGGFFGNRNNNTVTDADLCNANSFNELKSSVGRLSDKLGVLSDQNNNLAGITTRAICDLGYATLNNFKSLEQVVSSCCCQIERAIDNAVYTLANKINESDQRTQAAMQRILDRLCADKEAAQAARINNLEMREMLCGVVRYPLQTTYNAGNNPFYQQNCGRC